MISSEPNRASPVGHLRWSVCALLLFSVAVNDIHRLTIGIPKEPLSVALGWNETDYGDIAAAFSFAYAFGYLLGGRLLDRCGVKRGLPVFVFCWSLAATAPGFVSGLTGRKIRAAGSFVPVFAYFSGRYLLSLPLVHRLLPRIGRSEATAA